MPSPRYLASATFAAPGYGPVNITTLTPAVILDVLPIFKGDKGDTGPQGPQGIPGTGGSGSAAWVDITGKPTTLAGFGITDAATAAQGALAGTALQPAAIGVSVQGYSAVLQATTASYTAAEAAKLAGIAAGATANSTDAFLRDRANHTGTQAQGTVVNLTSDLAAKQDTLVSGTNIKTVNGNSLLGSGNVVISGGGGATGGSATLAYGAAPGTNVAETVVTGQAGIGAGARVRAWIQGDSTASHSAYQHSRILAGRVYLAVTDIIAGVGFTICASTELRLTGNIACRWEWSN